MTQMTKGDIYHLIQGSLDGILEPTTLSLKSLNFDIMVDINYEFSCNSLRVYVIPLESNSKILLSEQIYDVLYDEDIRLIDDENFALYITHEPMFYEERVKVYDINEER